MAFVKELIRLLHGFVARPWVLSALVFTNVVAYFGGLLYWYSQYINTVKPAEWIWPFIPDCPLWGLLGGLSLLIVVSKNYWTDDAEARTQRIILAIGALFTLLWLATYLPNAASAFVDQRSMLGLFCWTMLLFGALFRLAPSWLLAIAAAGNIKYGVWTVSAWLVYWRTTSLEFGAPHFSPDSIAMTTTHLGMIAQGVLLLTFFKPTRVAALAVFAWFALSDYVDYGLGYYPPIPEQFIPLPIMQWSTICVTILLSMWLWWLSTLKQPLVDDLPSADAKPLRTHGMAELISHSS